jgi:osmotically-inducible protein OsmY
MAMNRQQQLRARIQHVLDHDPRLQDSTIHVQVTQGVAALTGTVPTARLKPVAQALTLQVDGVQDVVNNVSVGSQATGVESTVSHRVTQAGADLARRVRAVLDEDTDLREQSIEVTVVRGQVMLTGVVAEQAHCLHAAERVLAVDGVIEVVNRLVPQSLHEALETPGDISVGPVQVTMQEQTMTVEGTVRSWDEKQAVLEAIAATGATYGIVDRLRVEPAPES